jgi:hypothetical protein
MNVSEIARHVGLQRMTVARSKTDPAAEAMLANWACLYVPVTRCGLQTTKTMPYRAGAMQADMRLPKPRGSLIVARLCRYPA